MLLSQWLKKTGFCLGGHGLSKGNKDCFWILKISRNSSFSFLCFLGTPLPLLSCVSCWNDAYWRPASPLYFENTWLVSLYKWQLEKKFDCLICVWLGSNLESLDLKFARWCCKELRWNEWGSEFLGPLGIMLYTECLCTSKLHIWNFNSWYYFNTRGQALEQNVLIHKSEGLCVGSSFRKTPTKSSLSSFDKRIQETSDL